MVDEIDIEAIFLINLNVGASSFKPSKGKKNDIEVSLTSKGNYSYNNIFNIL